MAPSLAKGGGRRALRSLVLCGLLVVAWATIHGTAVLERQTRVWPLLLSSPAYRAGTPGLGGDALALPATLPVPHELRVSRGQTLLGLFEDLGLGSAEALTASRVVSRYLEPRALRAGSEYSAYLGPGSELQRVVFYLPEIGEVEALRAADGWSSSERRYHRSVLEEVAEGVLDSLLESAMRSAGAPAELAYRLADVFQWDLDFSRDLRRGDRFRVLYGRVLIEGSAAGVKTVLAALYENRGEVLEAYRYGESGYYDGEGRPLRKQFLRSPLPYSRVTSRFSHRRFHPVLKTYRPHLGVDYGAPVGTPVRATANGFVAAIERTKSGGKTVKLRHPNGYLTAYLHLSGYARGIARGQRVRQGQTIGYVGATGLVTASHLDYRVQHNGRWVNPLGLENEPAPPLGEAELEDFRRLRDQQRLRLGAQQWSRGLIAARQGAAESGAREPSASRRTSSQADSLPSRDGRTLGRR